MSGVDELAYADNTAVWLMVLFDSIGVDKVEGLRRYETDSAFHALCHKVSQLADLARGYEQMKAERDEILAEIAATPWQGTPVEANVYHDDISWCIHLWHDGVSHDIRIPLAAHKAVTEGVQP